MINEGDSIAVGISGGKDSLTLLYALSGLKRFYPARFDLQAVTVDLRFKDFDTEPVKVLCDSLGIRYTVIDTQIYDIVFNQRRESNRRNNHPGIFPDQVLQSGSGILRNVMGQGRMHF